MLIYIFLVVSFLWNSIEIVLGPLDRMVEAMHDKVFLLKLVLLFLEKPFKDLGFVCYGILHHVNLPTSTGSYVLKVEIVHLLILERFSCLDQRLYVKVDWVYDNALLLYL
jgi:hypothetical protein